MHPTLWTCSQHLHRQHACVDTCGKAWHVCAVAVTLSCVCRYGLLGLLHVIRMTEPDLTMLALGTDLTGLGLNLNSPDPLYKVCGAC